jgi:hypothetical protein
VTSFEPLRCYVYREGLARFASSPYSTEDKHLKDAYRHLTNYSINKYAENFVENQQAAQDNVGHKWSFSAFNKHLHAVGADVELIWAGIMDLCLKTLISVRPVIASETKRATAHSSNCFELYGFDVLVDADLKPWLIEVNLSPSMLAESPLDMQVKSAVLSDTFNIVGVANASWRTLATAKLRSQLIQMRHSMAMAGQAAEAFKNGNVEVPDAPDPDGFVDKLTAMSERDLKMMAQALKEVSRCNNFIRLYPTATTVKRYAPLMRSPSPASKLLLRMLLGDDVQIPEADDKDGEDRISPRRSSPRAPKRVTQEVAADRSSWQSGSAGATSLKSAMAASTSSLARAAAGKKDEANEEEDEQEEEENLDWSGINSEVDHNAARTRRAIDVLKQLNMKASSRVVLLEYLVRIVNVCRALRMEGRTRLAQSKSYKRIAGFRQQLSIWLRTTGKASKHPPPADDIDGDFIEQLAATCRASIACVSKELWTAASALAPVPLSPEGSRGRLNLPAQLPAAFAKSDKGERVVETVQSLSSGDLEFVLQGPACMPEFASLLSTKTHASDEFQGFEELERMIECCGVTSGPLSDLLNALCSSEPMRRAGQATSECSRLKPVSIGSLPDICSGTRGGGLLAHATATCSLPRHPLGLSKDPAYPAAHGSAASMLTRLAAQRADLAQKPKPKVQVTSGMYRTQSLPALNPNNSPLKQGYLPQKPPGLASLRTKQRMTPLRVASDFMNMDIEF